MKDRGTASSWPSSTNLVSPPILCGNKHKGRTWVAYALISLYAGGLSLRPICIYVPGIRRAPDVESALASILGG